MTDAPIGIFDSGVGGLTVARAILDQLPHEQVIRRGDSAHLPRGDRPIADVQRAVTMPAGGVVRAGA